LNIRNHENRVTLKNFIFAVPIDVLMNSSNPEENESFQDEKQAAKNYVRYTGIGFQMIAVIGLFTFIGYKIDQSRESSQPIFTAVLGLIGVCIALFQVVRSLKK
jgi:F0F1-type ATP synthase assembly protein I